MLQLRGIARSFGRGQGRVLALDGVDLDLGRGRLVGLFGNNGAGKTTLLRVIAGLVEPDAGEVRVAGRLAGSHRRGLDVGYAGADDRSFYPRLSVRDNLIFHGEVRGMTRGHVDSRIEMCIAQLGLAASIDRPFQALSSGQRQRVNLARALLHEPPILLLDEPTRSLDPPTSQLVLDLARQAADAGTLVLLSSHELSGVEPRCHDIVLLDRGIVALAGPREEVFPQVDQPTWRLHFHSEQACERAIDQVEHLEYGDVPAVAILPAGHGEAEVATILGRSDLDLASVERRDRPSVSAMLRALPERERAAPAAGNLPEGPRRGEQAVTAAPRHGIIAGYRALVRRDRLIHMTFKFRLLVQVTLIGVWAGLYNYFAKLIGSDDPEIASALRGDAFGFLLMGLIGLQLSQVTLIQMAQSLREEQVAGTLEPLLASGRNPLLLVTGFLLWPWLIAIALIIGMLGFTQSVLDADFALSGAFPAAVAVLLGSFAFSAFGLISASFVLAVKRGDPVGGVLNMASLIVAGAYFPRELLPDTAQAFASLLPHTHLLAALRASLLDGAGFGDAAFRGPLLRLLFIAVILCGTAVLAWIVAWRYARRAGSLTDA